MCDIHGYIDVKDVDSKNKKKLKNVFFMKKIKMLKKVE